MNTKRAVCANLHVHLLPTPPMQPRSRKRSKTDVSIRHRGAGPAKKQTSWAKLSVNLTRARDSLISFLVRIKRPRQSSPTDKWGCSVGALPNQEELTTTDERAASDARVVPHVSDSYLVGARVWQGREAWLPVVYGLSLAWQCCNVGIIRL
jgi:hypothetical protein